MKILMVTGKGVWALLKFAGICAAIWTVFYVAIFTTYYNTYWSEIFRGQVTFHEQQKAYSVVLESQQDWKETAHVHRAQLIKTHQELIVAERSLRMMEKEYYHFIRTLERIDPEALDKVLRATVEPSRNWVFPFLESGNNG